MLRADSLSFGFGPNSLFEAASLRVEAGAGLAVLGRSGVGKSTLLRLISGLLRPHSGSVSLNNQYLIHDGEFVGDVAAFRRQVVLVPQEGGLWSTMSAADNIALPLMSLRGLARGAANARARELAESVSITSSALARLPGELSGGQRQKVAILRALALGASHVLLDEPTANLDPVSSFELARLVTDARARGLSAVIVTHDLGFAQNAADRYQFLQSTRLGAEKAMTNIQADPDGVVQAFLRGAGTSPKSAP